jgi:hypothetical protein
MAAPQRMGFMGFMGFIPPPIERSAYITVDTTKNYWALSQTSTFVEHTFSRP